MTEESPLGQFLRNRRDRLKPEDVGVVPYGPRRVPGLRRDELARLAGVSATYYARLEQGQSCRASEAVIDALARALGLDDDERSHLHDLARPLPAKRRAAAPRPAAVRPGAVQLLNAMTDVPAVLLGIRNEVLAWNRLGHLLLAGHLDPAAPTRPADRPNLTRMLFLDRHHRDLYPSWEEEATRAVAAIRLVAGRHPDDRELAELIGELTMKSPEFATLWARHPVGSCASGVKRFRHPEVGELTLEFEALLFPAEPERRILAYTAAPGTPSEAALQLLHGLAAPEAAAAGTPARPVP